MAETRTYTAPPKAPPDAADRPPVNTPSPGAPPPAAEKPPGLRDQVGSTKSAATRLVAAHVQLAKAEASEVADEVKRVAVLSGIAVGLLIVVAFLVTIGLMLFVGEALFGSLGWGVLHGTLLLVDVAIACVLVALGVSGVGRGLALGVVVAIVVGLVLGLDLTNRGWTLLGDQVAGQFPADIRPLVVGAGSLAIIGAVLGLVVGFRGGGRGAVAGLVLGAVAGALLGALTAIALGPRVGAAVGITAGLITWLAMMVPEFQKVDGEALKARFMPQQTIDMTKETIEWVREQTPLGRKS